MWLISWIFQVVFLGSTAIGLFGNDPYQSWCYNVSVFFIILGCAASIINLYNNTPPEPRPTFSTPTFVVACVDLLVAIMMIGAGHWGYGIMAIITMACTIDQEQKRKKII